VRGVLVDAGPLVAILDADDAFHEACVATLRDIREPMITVWPALTEATHLVGSNEARDRLLEIVEQGGLRIAPLDSRDVPRMRALMQKYRDRPMDLTDAALVRVGERDGFQTVFTIDRTDFTAYRLHGTRRFQVLP
jgi:predicted nucleic acid-binding protein